MVYSKAMHLPARRRPGQNCLGRRNIFQRPDIASAGYRLYYSISARRDKERPAYFGGAFKITGRKARQFSIRPVVFDVTLW